MKPGKAVLAISPNSRRCCTAAAVLIIIFFGRWEECPSSEHRRDGVMDSVVLLFFPFEPSTHSNLGQESEQHKNSNSALIAAGELAHGLHRGDRRGNGQVWGRLSYHQVLPRDAPKMGAFGDALTHHKCFRSKPSRAEADGSNTASPE
jgi:hypothetical protein